MDATAELNKPYVRNDFLTAKSVTRYIDTTYPNRFSDLQKFTAVNEGLRANDAMEGCRAADRIADMLRHVDRVRERFYSELNLRDSL